MPNSVKWGFKTLEVTISYGTVLGCCLACPCELINQASHVLRMKGRAFDLRQGECNEALAEVKSSRPDCRCMRGGFNR